MNTEMIAKLHKPHTNDARLAALAPAMLRALQTIHADLLNVDEGKEGRALELVNDTAVEILSRISRELA